MCIDLNLFRNKIHLNWSDILWGYEHNYLGWIDVIDISKYFLATQETQKDFLILELSQIDKSSIYKIKPILESLVETKNTYDTDKWLFMILQNLFINRNEVLDPLGVVENIYADFDYPEEIESFVRYMPRSYECKPSQLTNDEITLQIYKNWERYLIKKQEEYQYTK
ncbi:DUF2247 family protein [Uruburuella testudinis]|uniref:DUF2247 family protein n=1 Tax=Uruburuella testudinis TaxID=1282863 RepID=A0ABY4DRB3_9NEIS|nr:DUF2247 family protein [Uruburuella testudinis]UOO81473.1 DUF2247 family protein [Uruburuella testudinis]